MVVVEVHHRRLMAAAPVPVEDAPQLPGEQRRTSTDPATASSSMRQMSIVAARVLLEKASSSAKFEHVEHETVRRRHGLSAVDVHAEVGQHAGDIREQERLVERDERQFPDVVWFSRKVWTSSRTMSRARRTWR